MEGGLRTLTYKAPAPSTMRRGGFAIRCFDKLPAACGAAIPVQRRAGQRAGIRLKRGGSVYLPGRRGGDVHGSERGGRRSLFPRLYRHRKR